MEIITKEEDNMSDNITVIVQNRTVFQSIISDIFTFGTLLIALFINYNYLGDSVLVKLLIIFCFFVQVIVTGSKKIKRMTESEALIYLQNNSR